MRTIYISSNQATTASDCFGARVAQTPSLSEYEDSKSFTGKVYPNPTEGLVQLEVNTHVLKSVTVNVIDMFGRYLFRNKKVIVNGNNKVSLNITSLASGTYIVEVRDGKIKLGNYKVIRQ